MDAVAAVGVLDVDRVVELVASRGASCETAYAAVAAAACETGANYYLIYVLQNHKSVFPKKNKKTEAKLPHRL